MIPEAIHLLLLTAAVFLALSADPVFSLAAGKERLEIRIDAARPAASFLPDEAFGAGLDGLHLKDLEEAYSPANVATMRGAPYRQLAYRLRTELGIEAWHWNEAGTWSDEARQEGYWTSSSDSETPVLVSYGYRLPRRGSTIDQAGNDGYSRLDDGDEGTFWKSNPYLDAFFTGDDNALHPQWLIIDLGSRTPVNALRILWHQPYAVRYEVQYWDGRDADHLNELTAADWRPFDHGQIRGGTGGDAMLRLCDAPIPVRFVRILLTASSGTGPETTDVRDRLGYAIREVYTGVLDSQGRFQDSIRHGTSRTSQTLITVSSTDPWHRATDRNPKTAQPGFDLIADSGLGKGNPVLIPVPVLYNTPENAAAQIRFLMSRGFPINQIELGEEPDGQNTSPEHYGALYLQTARVIRGINPGLVTGGPGFQSEVEGWHTFADAGGEHSWMRRFLDYLGAKDGMDTFGFLSFEWYPFDDVCEDPTEQLIRQPALMRQVLQGLEADGVPRDIPWILSEYGYSSFSGRAEVELPAALLNAEIVAQFLTLGGKAAFYYGLEPNIPIRELDQCDDEKNLWGNLMMFQTRPDGRAPWRLPAYYEARMLVDEWAQPDKAAHRLFHASVLPGDHAPDSVTAYAVHRPDGRWALMILNKNKGGLTLGRIRFDGAEGRWRDWHGPLEVVQYSPRQYAWRDGGPDGRPVRSRPPVRFQARDGLRAGISLPPLSLTVVRGAGPPDGRGAMNQTQP